MQSLSQKWFVEDPFIKVFNAHACLRNSKIILDLFNIFLSRVFFAVQHRRAPNNLKFNTLKIVSSLAKYLSQLLQSSASGKLHCFNIT